MMLYHSHSQRLTEQGMLPLQVEPEPLVASLPPPPFYSPDSGSAGHDGSAVGCTENHLQYPSTLYPSPTPSYPPYDHQPALFPTSFLYDPTLDSGANDFYPATAANYSLYSATPHHSQALMTTSSGSEYDDSLLEHRRGSSNSSIATTVFGGPSYSGTEQEMMYMDEDAAASLQQSMSRMEQGQHEAFVGWKRGREEEGQQQGLGVSVGDHEDWGYHQQQAPKRYRTSAVVPPPPANAPVTPPSSVSAYPSRRAFTDPAAPSRYQHHPHHHATTPLIAPIPRSSSMSIARTLSYGALLPTAERDRTIPRSHSYDGVLPATRYPIARPASPTQPVVLKKFTLPASQALSNKSPASTSPRIEGELESAARFEPLMRAGGWAGEDGCSMPSTPGRRGSGEEWTTTTTKQQQQQQLYSPISPPHHLHPAPPPQQVGDFYPPPSTPATSTVPLARFPPASASSTLPLPEEPMLLPVVTPRQQSATSRRKVSTPHLPGNGAGGEPPLPTLPGRRPSLAPRPVLEHAPSSSVAAPPPPVVTGITVVLPSPTNAKGRPSSSSSSQAFPTVSLPSPSPSSLAGPGPISTIHPRFNGSPAPSSSTTALLKEADKSHPCEFKGCGKMFRRLEHLKRHERSHTQERPYGCEACGKWFSRSDNLAQHKKTHAKALGLGSSPPPPGRRSQSSAEPVEVAVAVPRA